jgi:hypothetical protein
MGLVVAFSPYFIFTSLFVGNNIMVLPSLLLFLITNFSIFQNANKKSSPFLFFCNGLFLGLIAEFELSFGLFIIPTYVIAHFVFPELKKVVQKKSSLVLSLGGLLIAFIPRILFELKNKFEQTKILLSFLVKPKLYNPKPFQDIFHDRVVLFWGYWEGIFPNQWWCLGVSLILVALVLFFIMKKKRISSYILFLSYVIGMLFIFSLSYKDNFWGNYYEGIQYVMLCLVFFMISLLNPKEKWVRYGFILFCCIFSFTQLPTAIQAYTIPPKKDGLAIQEDAMRVILQNETAQKDYCVRIYTPPVIPHTYNYLFLLNELKGSIRAPSTEWFQGTCWFIVEADTYAKRRDDWLNTNVPKDPHTVITYPFKDVEVRYYKVLPHSL